MRLAINILHPGLLKSALTISTFTICLLLSCHEPALAKERQLSLKWSELEAAVLERKVSMALPDGEIVEGKVLSVSSDSLALEVGKTSNRQKYPKGRISIPRSSVSVLRAVEVRGIWRALGPVLGCAVGLAAGTVPAQYFKNEAKTGTGAVIIVGLAGAGAGLGYLAGSAADRDVLVITIVL